MLIWNTYLCLIPFPVGAFFLFSNPDTIYQFCLNNTLLNVALPFLSSLPDWAEVSHAGQSQHLRPVLLPWCIFLWTQAFYSCCLERTFWNLLVPSVWTGISLSFVSLGKKTFQVCSILAASISTLSSRPLNFFPSCIHPGHSTQTCMVNLATNVHNRKPVAHWKPVYLPSKTAHFHLPPTSLAVISVSDAGVS